MKWNSEQMRNQLTASIDWLSFTVFDLETVDDVISFLGYSPQEFSSLPKGGMGYKSMMKLEGYPVSILYDGKEDMGIHVTISGKAIPEVVRSYRASQAIDTPFGQGFSVSFDSSFMIDFLRAVKEIGQVSRIDLAIDDFGCKYFSTDDLVQALTDGRCVSKFRTWRNVCEKTMTGEKTGHTVYMGSRTSEIFLRVYDKRLEQRKQGMDGQTPIDTEWIRWEFELKGDRANQVMDALISRDSIGSVCFGLLSNYFRIINLDNNNRSRCSVDPLWEKFIDRIRPLKLYVPDSPKTLEDKKQWVLTQVMPTLAGIVIADSGSLEFITDNLVHSAERMGKDMIDLVQRENPDWRTYYDAARCV
jgi:phage replication initiation protein